MNIEYVLLIISALLFVGVISSKISTKFNIPALLMFLLLGVIIGIKREYSNIATESFYGINFLSILAMSFILYTGGLSSNIKVIKPIIKSGISLATLGVFLTAIFMGVGAWLILQWPLQWSFLLAAVISSTDSAAVFSILRGKSLSLKGDLPVLLEFESGSNDPMATFLTLFIIGGFSATSNSTFLLFFPLLIYKMAIGIVIGYLLGRFGVWLFNKISLEFDGLYLVLGIAIVLITYGGVTAISGNGFISCYVCGLTMGSRRFNYKNRLMKFNDGVSWLMQLALFMVLGMMLNLSQIGKIFIPAIVLSLILMLVARPLAVYISLLKSKYKNREKLLISWVGLRGAAPIVLATFPMYMLKTTEQQNYGKELFNIVFFIVILSVFFQGRTLKRVAKFLKLDEPFSEKISSPLELEESNAISSVMREFTVSKNSKLIGLSLAEINLHESARVMLIRRKHEFLLARGNSVIHENDGLFIMGEECVLFEIENKYFFKF